MRIFLGSPGHRRETWVKKHRKPRSVPAGKVAYLAEDGGEWIEADAQVSAKNSVDYVTGFEGKEDALAVVLPAQDAEGHYVGIHDNAFEHCSKLREIDIPEGVRVVGGYTFNGCSSLSGVAIPDSVTSVWGGAFQGCSSLSSVRLGATRESRLGRIANYAFRNCVSLTGAAIPSAVAAANYGVGLFEGCSSLAGLSVDRPLSDLPSLANFPWGLSSGFVVAFRDGESTVP